MNAPIENIKFDEAGLVPVVVQDANTREVLTLAYMNSASLKRTIETRETWFWSRSRASLWHKGETSGHFQRVKEILVDCDSDALIVLVETNGPACHTGRQSCFHRVLLAADDTREEIASRSSDLGAVLYRLYGLVESRKRDQPKDSYTTYLFEQGLDKILKKIGEEATETVIAAKNEDRAALANETSDLIYHLIVLLVERGVTLNEIRDELVSRGRAGEAE